MTHRIAAQLTTALRPRQLRPRQLHPRNARSRDLRSGDPRRDESGMTTAEYAVGTISACSFAGVLYKILTSGFGQQLLEDLFNKVMTLLPF